MPELIEIECREGRLCRNSVSNAGLLRSKCATCRLGCDQQGFQSHHWNPIAACKGTKHPVLEQEKKDARRQKLTDSRNKLRQRDPLRRKVARQAARAEERTQKSIIRATKNSGRSNKDADHVSVESITLDTKLQSDREHPVVQLHELEKVRSDAARAGYSIGGLVLRNKNNVGVVVLSEEDYARLVSILAETMNEQR